MRKSTTTLNICKEGMPPTIISNKYPVKNHAIKLTTFENIIKEWEALGFEIISCSKERFEVYKHWIEKGHHTNAKVVIDNQLYIVGQFSNKDIQLLIKTLNWRKENE